MAVMLLWHTAAFLRDPYSTVVAVATTKYGYGR